LPLFRGTAQQLFRRKVLPPIAVLDLQDSPSILRCNLHLLKVATLYFKRELPPDRWQLFLHSGKTPTPRYRRASSYRAALSRIRPLSLGLPDHMLAHQSMVPSVKKDIDIFFAGRLSFSSTVRERGAPELAQLSNEGLRVEIGEAGMTPVEYLNRCARAWLVWCPEGYGWDCFRTYESAFAGSVPLISRQTIERHQPLLEGQHCFYYDVETGQVAEAARRALGNRERLKDMAAAAREHVLMHHTSEALAHHVVGATLDEAGRFKPQ
jgi:glycosyltransferase involved in cell wall biosynthesis